MISLVSFNYLVAEKDMPCDALQVWMDLKLKMPQLEKGVTIWFGSRKGIEVNDKYIQYEFLDTETGELLYMNCIIRMDDLMRKEKFYPKMIAYAIEQYEKKLQSNINMELLNQ